MAKFCVNCKYHQRRPVQMSPDRAGMVPMCHHEEFLHPVHGQPMACETVRSEDRLCGLVGKGFVKSDDPPKDSPTEPKTTSRILTAT